MTQSQKRVRAADVFARRFLFAFGFLAATVTARAQDSLVFQLVEKAWNHGASATLETYAALPAGARSATVLVSAADQLLWMGKHVEAAGLLARAAADAPHYTEVRFQQGRAALQGGDLERAFAAFRQGLDVLELDTGLTEQTRGSLRRRLENRVRFLARSDELVTRNGGYRSSDGRLLLFKFDPYINTFPSLLDPTTGLLRILYPLETSALEWRDANNRSLGTLAFDGGTGNNAVMVLRDSTRETRWVGLGIVQERLRYESAGAVIEGTLFRPRGTGRVPAVVLTHGAGLSSRYNLVLEALAYASAGLAAFVYDKPGLGKSTGGNWLLLSIKNQVAYVTSAVDLLTSRPDIGPVGVWGFSQGGWVAPMAAARSQKVAFIVIVSAAGVSPQEQFNQTVEIQLKKENVPKEQRDEALRHLKTVWTRVNAGAKLADLDDLYGRAASAPWGNQFPRLNFQWELDWWRQNEVDPAAPLRSLKVPFLAILGENDETVPPEHNASVLARHLSAANSGDYTVTVLPKADHQLMVESNYQMQYFYCMVDWVTSRFGNRRAGTFR